ncbi:MAG: hypothetical protein K6G50_09595 [bacterium]|nr:hypothetical protein [bacterium]
MNICTECGSPILPGKTVCDACEAMAKSLASEERSSLNRHVPVLRVVGTDRKAPKLPPADPETIPDDRIPGKHVELPLYLRIAAGFVLVAFAFTSFAGPISFMMRQNRQAESARLAAQARLATQARLAAQARARAMQTRNLQPIRVRRNFNPVAETASASAAGTSEFANATVTAESADNARPIRVRHPET